MRNNGQTNPLTVIQQDLLDGTISTTRMLQKCIVLAGSIGSTALRDWARRELDGYPYKESSFPLTGRFTLSSWWTAREGLIFSRAKVLGRKIYLT